LKISKTDRIQKGQREKIIENGKKKGGSRRGTEENKGDGLLLDEKGMSNLT